MCAHILHSILVKVNALDGPPQSKSEDTPLHTNPYSETLLLLSGARQPFRCIWSQLSLNG